ncbi:MAG: hypothetical protein MI865_09095, partial [Proteobacteria bacterium]|nr:hypothetical protein [Pseudomonadota bacterium]
MELDQLIEQTAEPDVTSNRLQTLLDNEQAARIINSFTDEKKAGLIKIIGVSRFLYHFLNKDPDSLQLIGTPFQDALSRQILDVKELRQYKYRSLLQIAWMDICNICPYETILHSLSSLADSILIVANRLVTKPSEDFIPDNDIAIMALGKLGANELNFSSDVDLMFILGSDDDNKQSARHEYYTQHIRQFCRLLTENSEDGFLYRV